jgi:hypothetical protein
VEVDEEVVVDLHPAVGRAVDSEQPGAQPGVELGVSTSSTASWGRRAGGRQGRAGASAALRSAPGRRRLACEHAAGATGGRSVFGLAGSETRTGAGRRAASWRNRGSGRPSRGRGRSSRRGTGNGQPSSSTGIDGDHLVGGPGRHCRGGSATSCSKARRDEALLGVGVVQPPHLERKQARSRRGRRSALASARPDSRNGCGGRSGRPRHRRGSKPFS